MVMSYEIIYCERSKKYIANLQGFGIMDVYIHVDGVIKADVFSMFGSGQYMYKKRMDKTKFFNQLLFIICMERILVETGG